MKILVTGVAGFIGSRLAEWLLSDGHEVEGIDNLSTGRATNVPDGVAFRLADVREPLTGEWDAIYHCAASYRNREDWESDASVNVMGTINVVRAANRSNARLIYFQTSLCYGPNPESPVSTKAPLDPRGSYAVSKTAGEMFIRDSGVDYVSLRLANVYGPRNLSGPIPTFYQRLSAGLPCTVMDSRRDFVYVDDLVWVAVRCLRNWAHVPSAAYHVASGHDVSIAELYAVIREAMGLPPDEPEVIPRGRDDVATLLLDPSRTFEIYGWAAKTPLRDGIAKAVAWYRDHPVTETFTHLAQVTR